MARVSHPGGACSFTAHEHTRPACSARRPRRAACNTPRGQAHQRAGRAQRDSARAPNPARGARALPGPWALRAFYCRSPAVGVSLMMTVVSTFFRTDFTGVEADIGFRLLLLI